jgi:hypothetical protein
LAAFLNGQPLAVTEETNGVIRLELQHAAPIGEQWLVLACKPFYPSNVGVSDHRALGLPIAALDIVAAEQATLPPTRAAA